MSGPESGDRVPEVDVAALTDDQRDGLACVNCGRSGGRVRPIDLSHELQATRLVAHADSGVCVRHVARYVATLHMRMVDIAEHAIGVLVEAEDG